MVPGRCARMRNTVSLSVDVKVTASANRVSWTPISSSMHAYLQQRYLLFILCGNFLLYQLLNLETQEFISLPLVYKRFLMEGKGQGLERERTSFQWERFFSLKCGREVENCNLHLLLHGKVSSLQLFQV